MEYTKGNWQAFERGMGDMTIRCNSKDVAEILTFKSALDGAESQANANLVASAPDLYEMCQEMLVELKRHKDIPLYLLEMWRKRLAKAEGKDE